MINASSFKPLLLWQPYYKTLVLRFLFNLLNVLLSFRKPLIISWHWDCRGFAKCVTNGLNISKHWGPSRTPIIFGFEVNGNVFRITSVSTNRKTALEEISFSGNSVEVDQMTNPPSDTVSGFQLIGVPRPRRHSTNDEAAYDASCGWHKVFSTLAADHQLNCFECFERIIILKKGGKENLLGNTLSFLATFTAPAMHLMNRIQRPDGSKSDSTLRLHSLNGGWWIMI